MVELVMQRVRACCSVLRQSQVEDEHEHCIGPKMISGNLTCMKECEIRCPSA